MGDLSKNFSKHEFVCDCKPSECKHKVAVGNKWICDQMVVDAELIKVLQDTCDFFSLSGEKVVGVITSGYRCDWWNGKEGGSRGSKHTSGIACDWKIKGVVAKRLYDYLGTEHPDKYGIGLYSNRVHLDTRIEKARWEIK
jgi:uncharacterized protein YcbK (DUF882 family)